MLTNGFGDSLESPKRFTTATHKCVSLFWQIFLALSSIKCRKVTTHKCPRMDVYAPCINVETEPKMGDGENWTKKFGKLNRRKTCVSSFPSAERSLLALAIMKKLKNGCHFVNIDHTEKFQITDPPKAWISGCLSVNRNGISASAIMKNWKWLPFC